MVSLMGSWLPGTNLRAAPRDRPVPSQRGRGDAARRHHAPPGVVATLDSQTVVLRESLTPMSPIQGDLHSCCQGCVCSYGATCRRASLFSVCREGHRRRNEFAISMDPQKHTQPTLTYPLSRVALSYSSIPSVWGGPTGTPTPACPLSKGIPAPPIQGQGWGGCYEPLNFSGCLLVGHRVPRQVRSPHGAISQDMPCWWPWVHPQLWDLGASHQEDTVRSSSSRGGEPGSHPVPEETGTGGRTRGPLRSLGLSWGSALWGGLKTWGWAGGFS